MDPAVLNWPCGEDPFLLRIGELEALDDLTAEGVLDLRWRLAQGAHRGSLAYAPVKVREVIACLRLGLIGAGMDRATAERKSRQAFEEGDIGALNLIAFTILSNAFAGKEHDPVGRRKRGGDGEGQRIRFSRLYGNGVALGFTPAQVKEMSMWELTACLDGWNRAQGAGIAITAIRSLTKSMTRLLR
ncbi:GTA-gp10 family protein [Paracoccus cavernae]|uniref:GTA-gp10 family protein n=1 Tax=Paracoccus cavernae TaxID=1571207 RepID=A0ABT8D9J7_9RHOB|nr:GTA-gp10 family protein [Paracoccus cavernae]